jgi:kynurenine formamidase
VVDLGALVTADLAQRMWGRALLNQMAWTGENRVELLEWAVPVEGGTISGSNAYYTLFNHGGPHVDAPVHMGESGGIDVYPIDAFSGPAKVVDVREFPVGRSVPVSVFQGRVQPGDVVLLVTGYSPPGDDRTLPEVRTITHEADESLATLPVRAIGTDAWSIEALGDMTVPLLHHPFLSRRIPIYEQLLNLERLLGKDRMFFVGVPLNIKDGDGMMVRPVVLVY